jgi:hypothetical protein
MQCSQDGVTWVPWSQGGTQLPNIPTAAITFFASGQVAFGVNNASLAVTSLLKFIRALSGTQAAPVNQLQLTAFTWILCPDIQRKP